MALTPPSSPYPPPPDAIHAAVQPAGEAAAAKMVPGHLRQGAEEDGSGAYAGGSGSQAQDGLSAEELMLLNCGVGEDS